MARQSTKAVTPEALKLPGAVLYYEVTGSGPVLLLIPGDAGDAEVFSRIVPLLAGTYTVVTYDPRGVSRSRLDGPAEDVPVERHADDAQQLLIAIGGEPASVLGSSGGAVIGLALAERHSEIVQTLVAHEPPLIQLLPQGSARRTGAQEIYDIYLKEGAGPAMAQFMIFAGMERPEPPVALSPERQEAFARMQQNTDFFLAHYLLPITAYVPDIAALREGLTRVVVGVGDDSGGQLAHDTALALAELLGTPPMTFPGGHVGYVTRPEAFVAKLHEVLQANSPERC